MAILSRVTELLEQGITFCLATVVSSDEENISPGKKIIIFDDGALEGGFNSVTLDSKLSELARQHLKKKKNGTIKIEDKIKIFLNIISAEAKLLICGAGHIAVPLAQFAHQTGFRVTVLDDRPDFANISRFPNCAVKADNFVKVLKEISLGPTSYAVVITRGHEHDAECLQEILKKETAYVGLIGSRRRVRFVLEALNKKGIPQERLKEVFTPIGLPIGSESPVEIALAIVSELVCVRRKGSEQASTLRIAGGIH